MQKIRVRLLWYHQAQFAGYHVAEHLGLARDTGCEIECQPVRFDQAGTDSVLSGDAEFAVASPSHLLESRSSEALRFLLTIQQESSLIYPVRASSKIKEIADLRGHRIAVWPGHEDLELRWMLFKSGVDDRSVDRVPLTNTLEAFIMGNVDCAQMTTYHEWHKAIEALGHDNIRAFSAASVGASLIKDGLLANRNWLENNREQAQAVINAVLQGWSLAFTNERLAVDACMKSRPDMTKSEHVAQLRAIKCLSVCGAALTHGLGYPDRQHIQRCLQAMNDLGIERRNMGDDGFIDSSFWDSAPAKWRSRDWPQE